MTPLFKGLQCCFRINQLTYSPEECSTLCAPLSAFALCPSCSICCMWPSRMVSQNIYLWNLHETLCNLSLVARVLYPLLEWKRNLSNVERKWVQFLYKINFILTGAQIDKSINLFLYLLFHTRPAKLAPKRGASQSLSQANEALAAVRTLNLIWLRLRHTVLRINKSPPSWPFDLKAAAAAAAAAAWKIPQTAMASAAWWAAAFLVARTVRSDPGLSCGTPSFFHWALWTLNTYAEINVSTSLF